MFRGEKTALFWAGLLVFGYSLTQFGSAISQAIYYLVILPTVQTTTITIVPFSTYFLVQSLYISIPDIISGIIFAIIGLYMMKKGIRKEQRPIPWNTAP